MWERLLEEAKEGAVKVGGVGELEEGSGDCWRSQLEQVSPPFFSMVVSKHGLWKAAELLCMLSANRRAV